jgi:phenylacetic acid degradation operon negative regulatory protein
VIRVFSKGAKLLRDEGWVLVAFSIPEKNRALSYQLRSRLIRVGFAQVTGGLWIAPRQLTNDVTALAKSLNIEKYMSIFLGTPFSVSTNSKCCKSMVGFRWN